MNSTNILQLWQHDESDNHKQFDCADGCAALYAANDGNPKTMLSSRPLQLRFEGEQTELWQRPRLESRLEKA
jgi:hypothetical protein